MEAAASDSEVAECVEHAVIQPFDPSNPALLKSPDEGEQYSKEPIETLEIHAMQQLLVVEFVLDCDMRMLAVAFAFDYHRFGYSLCQSV